MPPRSNHPAATRPRPLLPRILRVLLITLSLLVCLAFGALWSWGNGADRPRTWQSGRRTFQVASWDGRLEYRVVGAWLDETHAAQGTALLALRSGFAYQPAVETMNRQLAQQHETLAAQAAKADPKVPAYRPMPGQTADPLSMSIIVLDHLSNTLVTEHPPLARTFAGVTVERATCRLPMRDGAGHIAFDPPVPVLSIYAPCWLPVVLFGALPGYTLLSAAGRSYIRRKRIERHRCPGCGYDLRASPGTCPECGEEFAPPPLEPAAPAAPTSPGNPPDVRP